MRPGSEFQLLKVSKDRGGEAPENMQESEAHMNEQSIRAQGEPCKGTVAACTKCGSHTYVSPLHDDRGGPLFCFMCAGAWHAEHAPRRRARRVLIKALKAYETAGGNVFDKDFDQLKVAATGFFYFRNADRVGDDFSDLTSELLAATIALTHPDKHPTERKAEATRVTQELQALKPFVFPAPEPEPPPKPGDALFDTSLDKLNKPSQPDYPCDDCEFALPMDYCDSCKAQHEKKWQEENEREDKERQRKNARQREYYQINKAVRESIACAMCGDEFESKRSDAVYCSAACRQRAYVKRDGKVSNSKPLSRNDIERAIKTAFTTKPDSAFTTDNLCEHVYCLKREQIERKHRAAVLPIAKKVCEQLETWDWYKPWLSNGLIFWNRVSLISTAMSNLVARAIYDSEKKLKAAISPGGDWHDEVVEGGSWWNAWQEDVAYFKNNKGPTTNGG